MKNFITFFYLFAILQLSGCSINTYPTGDISKNPKAVKMEFRSIEDVKRLYPNANIDIQDDVATYSYYRYDYQEYIKNIDFNDENTISVKYYRSLIYTAPNVSVMLELPNGNKYPAYVDTGCPTNMLLTSDIVLENKFEILPITDNNKFQGICQIPEFNIGKIKVEDALVYYNEQQWQLRILNIPIYKHPSIIIGIDFIKSFNYVLFDNVNQEVEFSKDKTFSPDNSESWQSYLFEIKPDANSNDRLMVQMPINGTIYEPFFDTCGDKPGLNLSQRDWETLSKNVTFKNLHKTYSYNFQSGRYPHREATISKLTIGEKKFKNAKVQISNKKSELSVLSLGYFQDTTVVLDFVNSLLWIKEKE